MMSDLPTLYRQAWELNEHAPNAVYTVDHIGVYYEGYLVPVEEPLLTREEAAADPEVRMLILDIYTRDAKAARVMDVEADGRDLLCPFCGGSGPRNDDRWHRSDCDRR